MFTRLTALGVLLASSSAFAQNANTSFDYTTFYNTATFESPSVLRSGVVNAVHGAVEVSWQGYEMGAPYTDGAWVVTLTPIGANAPLVMQSYPAALIPSTYDEVYQVPPGEYTLALYATTNNAWNSVSPSLLVNTGAEVAW